ncbi:Mitochondrial import receptor subunit Tom22 [Rhizoctonia solani]|uniref:Mitochondrial import receptor subunit Tom22 n=1 Tax=Rhizoctonia solani TaxID=456999 RepID=A0A8H7IGW2_9AGAM|nr:Mitochondrial import receptor subunit Tom22 [Rhizoctonia solani]
MVKVEEIRDKDLRSSSPYGSSEYSSSSDSVASTSSSLSTASSPEKETLGERLAALVDIVPPTTRQSIGLPLALALEDEAKIVQQEKEMLAQQQGAQGMLAPYGQQGQQGQPGQSSSSGLVPPGF